MSKSAPDAGSRILLTDTPAQIAKKVRAAVTDADPHIAYAPATRPGTANLLAILGACTGAPPEDVARRYEGAGHGALKRDVADAVCAALEAPRREFERVRADEAYLERVAADGAARARAKSAETLKVVRERVGLA
jgi:tryptophanyl-tRNA synthetase